MEQSLSGWALNVQTLEQVGNLRYESGVRYVTELTTLGT
jgi:hypothetical protein